MRIIGLAVNKKAIGTNSKKFTATNDFILAPSGPQWVAPGDSFEYAVTLRAGDKTLEKPLDVKLSLSSKLLTQLEGNMRHITLEPSQEKTLVFHFKANDEIGSANIQVQAMSGPRHSQLNSKILIRPNTLNSTTTLNGFSHAQIVMLPVTDDYYAYSRKLFLSASHSPQLFAQGLRERFSSYENDSTSNLSSQLFFDVFANKSSEINKKLDTIRQRQQFNGQFQNHLTKPSTSMLPTLYTLDILTSLKDNKIYYDATGIQKGLNYLQDFVEKPTRSLDMAKQQAYAIYLLTRNEKLTTNAINHLMRFLTSQKNNAYQQDLTMSYLAASYQLMHQKSLALKKIKQYSEKQNSLTDNMHYISLLSSHFPSIVLKQKERRLEQMINALNNSALNTQAAVYTLRALINLTSNEKRTPLSLSVYNSTDSNSKALLANNNTNINHLAYPPQSKNLIFKNPNASEFFYQITQAGFKRKAAHQRNGLEITQQLFTEDKQNNIIKLGENVKVKIRLKAIDNKQHDNIRVVVLLPGGFELIPETLENSEVSYHQQDRILFYTQANSAVTTLSFTMRAMTPGQFTLPAVIAEDSDNPAIKAYGKSHRVTIENI